MGEATSRLLISVPEYSRMTAEKIGRQISQYHYSVVTGMDSDYNHNFNEVSGIILLGRQARGKPKDTRLFVFGSTQEYFDFLEAAQRDRLPSAVVQMKNWCISDRERDLIDHVVTYEGRMRDNGVIESIATDLGNFFRRQHGRQPRPD